MTKRNQIFESLKSGLLNIKRTNGYTHDINKVFPVLRTLDDVNEYPSVYFIMGEEEIRPEFEDRNTFGCTLQVIILTHIEANYDLNAEGLFTPEAESWVEDYQKFIADENPATGCLLGTIPGVENYYVSKIEPYSDWRENKQTLAVTITIQYINFI
jgi:hypothetical protein